MGAGAAGGRGRGGGRGEWVGWARGGEGGEGGVEGCGEGGVVGGVGGWREWGGAVWVIGEGEGRGGGVMEVYVGLGGSYGRVVVRCLTGDNYWTARLGRWMSTGWCFRRLVRYRRWWMRTQKQHLKHLYYGRTQAFPVNFQDTTNIQEDTSSRTAWQLAHRGGRV